MLPAKGLYIRMMRWKKGEPVTREVVSEAMTDLHLAAVDMGVAIGVFLGIARTYEGGPALDALEQMRAHVKVLELEMKVRLDKLRKGKV